MTSRAKTWWLSGLSLFMVLSAIYCALCVLQAACLFTGDRAVRNVQFWGTLCSVALVCALVCAVLAIRAHIKAKRRVICE